MDSQRLPDDTEPSALPPEREPDETVTGGASSYFVLKVAGGFLLTPALLFLMVAGNVPQLGGVGLLGVFFMLFFRSTRPFALGSILALGAGFLLLLAICGNSSF